jgi:histone deacetylase complex regulatory component SIN3
MSQLPPKIQSSPDYMFLNSLKDMFSPEIYKILIKILYLYVEGIISQYEFSVLISPYFDQPEQRQALDYFISLTNSKILNRRQHAVFDRPMCEIDFSKTRKISGYYELPKEYPIKISSGRTEFENSIFNDRLITIPTGSEDDKNPMKKNHYEENLFAFEDKRYEFDMQIEIFQYAIDKLNQFKEKIKDGTIKKEDITEELYQKMLGKNVVRLIIRYYRELGQKVKENLIDKTEGTINIIIKRFSQRIEEAKKKKKEEKKTKKSRFEKIYEK